MQRLKTRPQFQAVLAGSIVSRSEHFALHRSALDASLQVADKTSALPSSHHVLFPINDMWMGAMVPKRWAKRAVTRNAIKRQIYTVSAGFFPHYPHAAFLVRLRKEFSRKEFVSATSTQLKEVVRAEVTALLNAGAVSR